MNDTKTSHNPILFDREENSIQSMYDKVMHGFEGVGGVFSSDPLIDGYFQMLYAPGYEEIGVGEIVAKCK